MIGLFGCCKDSFAVVMGLFYYCRKEEEEEGTLRVQEKIRGHLVADAGTTAVVCFANTRRMQEIVVK